MDNRDTWVLIPAYKPDARLNELIDELFAAGFSRVITVDDGGGADFASFFTKAKAQGAVVLTHPENRGKGAALKTGLRYIAENDPMPVVTADADGQHSVKDIARIAQRLREKPGSLVLGTRDKSKMPPRSKAGNTITCVVLGLLSGLWIDDTQTGLRGIPVERIRAYSELEGDRYEFEMNMLLDTRKAHTPVEQVTIETIYIDDNKSSHFNVLRDSARIYGLMFKQVLTYLGSSLFAALIDLGVFTLLHYILPQKLLVLDIANPTAQSIVAAILPDGIGVPFLVARLISSLVNYRVNRDVVFKAGKNKWTIVTYYALVVVVMLCSMQGTKLLSGIGMHTVLAKVVSDIVLFILSYNVQKKWIFK